MTTLNRLPKLERVVVRLLAEISADLEQKATAALWKLSKTHQTERVTFCSAMGTFNFSIETTTGQNYRSVEPPIIRTFERIRDDYGYTAIPAPILLRIENGTFTRKTNW